MADAVMWATVAVAALVTALAAGLLAIYLRSYQRVRAPFTLGLGIFAGLFIAQGLFLIYADLLMLPVVEGVVAPLLLGIAVLEAAGLGAVLVVSRR